MLFRKTRPPVGARPGTLVIPQDAAKPTIHLTSYDLNQIHERELTDVSELSAIRENGLMNWIDIHGFGDTEVLRGVRDAFGLHPLAIADIVNVPNRPKAEDYDDHLFIITAMIRMHVPPVVVQEQLGLFIGENFVVTMQERRDVDALDPVRGRLRSGRGTLRKSGTDYLGYAIIDAIIDGYFPVLELLGEYFEDLEDEIVDYPTRDTLFEIYQVRRELITLRRTAWPQREALSFVMRDDSRLIGKSTQLYFRDCYDHLVQVIDVIENYRELAGSFVEIYLSGASNRLNEVMKVLTIISTIFIPLSFIVGVYGMNFKYMPELDVWWAYPAVWGVIIVSALTMILAFRKRGWLSFPWDKREASRPNQRRIARRRQEEVEAS